MTVKELKDHPAFSIGRRLILVKSVSWMDMTKEERLNNPKAQITGEYLRTFDYKEAWSNLWKTLLEEEKNSFKTLPNFDEEIFKDITGIEI